MSGWIKLHRSIQRHWLYTSTEPFTKREAWIDILLEVNHSPQKVCIDNMLLDCKCGESLNSLDTWAKRWKWNKSKVRRFLKLLESDSMCVSKSVQKTTHLTVCNYEKYQVERNADETQMKRKRNASETQATPNKNVKNAKNEKELTSVFSFDEFWDAYKSKKDRKKCEHKYKSISEEQRLVIKYHVPRYVRSTPEVQFRKNPATYLNGECWNDEVSIVGEVQRATKKTATDIMAEEQARMDATWKN